MYASIDMVLDKLERQMKKYEEKRVRNKTNKLKMSQIYAEEENSFKEPRVSDDDEVYNTY